MSQNHIAYYRVSTDRQGRSGLGLDAQRHAVALYLAGRGELVAEFTEVETGKKSDRPQLAAALAECRRLKATLLIAKLDRLARNVYFVSGLMESGVDFVAVDMPEANRLTIHILAAVAEYEADRVSVRTKEALAIAKGRGTRLGNPTPAPSLERGRATRAAKLEAHRQSIAPLVKHLRDEGRSLRAIAAELNARGIPTARRGNKWHPETVANVLER
jgi:DNA invertase Pin-like site-specific DNA recombinase